jgi:hypothetical protein
MKAALAGTGDPRPVGALRLALGHCYSVVRVHYGASRDLVVEQ